MKIEIPTEAQELYEKISKRYNLALEPLNIRGREIKIIKPADIEDLLGKDPLEELDSFPFWVKIWESAIVLADFIASIKPQRRILEIKGGLGVVGLTAAAFGHQEVVITDTEEECLDFIRLNALLNGLSNVKVERLDWQEPKDLGLFEVILGEEVAYAGRHFEDLFRLFKRYLAPGGAVYLAHDKEQMRTLAPFLYLAEKDFEEAVSQRKLRTGDEVYEIIISRLIPRDQTWMAKASA
jgi:predicted nicotinamide N-methyase